MADLTAAEMVDYWDFHWVSCSVVELALRKAERMAVERVAWMADYWVMKRGA